MLARRLLQIAKSGPYFPRVSLPAHRAIYNFMEFSACGRRAASSGGGGAGQEGNNADDNEVTWKSFVPLALLAGGAGAYWQITRYQGEHDIGAQVQVNQTIGKAQLGGPWRLMDTDARVRAKFLSNLEATAFCLGRIA